MEITIYAKKRTSKDGKVFYNYLSTLTRKDGTPQVVTVKFRDEAGQPRPDNCPMNIEFSKENANMSVKDFERKDGTPGKSYTMWVSAWSEGTPFVDRSMDDFE